MGDFIYKVTIRTGDKYEIRISAKEDYYEAISTGLERAIEYRGLCDPKQTTIDTIENGQLIRSERLFDIPQHEKILATVLNLVDKARITNDLELAMDELLIIDQWNKKAMTACKIEYRIAYCEYKVIIIIEGYHYAFYTEN